MKAFAKSLSPRTEAGIVLTICFGLWFVQSVRLLARYFISHQVPPDPPFTDGPALQLVAYELVVLLVVALVGWFRGWSFSTFGLRISWRLTAMGLGFGAVVCLSFAFLPLGIVGRFHGSMTWPVLVAVLLVNPFFEEALEVGYVVHAFGRYGMMPAIVASALLRAFFHVYLGLVGFAAVLVGGLAAGAVYWKWRQLWPLFIAHGLCDLMVLLPLVHRHYVASP
jgi:membrane protease YdiL (CAAX protease family)